MPGPRRLLPPSVACAVLVAGAGVLARGRPAAAATRRPRTLVGVAAVRAGLLRGLEPRRATATDLAQVGNTTAYAKDVHRARGQLRVQGRHQPLLGRELRRRRRLERRQHPAASSRARPARVLLRRRDATRSASGPRSCPGRPPRPTRRMPSDSLREPLTKERYYFVMADRFANGDTANDQGGLTGDKLTDRATTPPTTGYYHGGDLKGIAGKLDYIKGLGTTAIWLTPSLQEPARAGCAPANESAGYHGYWITDFTQVDPHLGTNADLTALISAAHAKGMKVFFDIITNHTADVINYSEGAVHLPQQDRLPLQGRLGHRLRRQDVCRQARLPAAGPGHLVPLPPVLQHPGRRDRQGAGLAERPRRTTTTAATRPSPASPPSTATSSGSTTCSPSSSTSRRAWRTSTRRGWTSASTGSASTPSSTSTWSSGSRSAPAMLEHAKAGGNDDFFMFGEVFDSRPSVMSRVHDHGQAARRPSTSGSRRSRVNWVQGKSGTDLRDLYADDDYYTDTDSNAYELPTFLGNHDMGRVAMLLKGPSADDADLMRRVKLADSLMFLTRGQPITYYGDEQGFMGSGGDKAARQDMFATQGRPPTPPRQVLGDTSGAKDRFNTERAALPAHQGAVGGAGGQPCPRRRRAGAPVRQQLGRRLRLLPHRQGQAGRVRRRAQQRDDGQVRDLRHLRPQPDASRPSTARRRRCARPRTAGSPSPSRPSRCRCGRPPRRWTSRSRPRRST